MSKLSGLGINCLVWRPVLGFSLFDMKPNDDCHISHGGCVKTDLFATNLRLLYTIFGGRSRYRPSKVSFNELTSIINAISAVQYGSEFAHGLMQVRVNIKWFNLPIAQSY